MSNKNAIVDALGEAREHLILNKFNDAMMLMAQITIDVIEGLIDDALIVSKGYEEDIKTLKSIGIISEDTAHNFETLIISGVQAHSGVDIPKEHAEKALEVLTNELDILFKRNEQPNLETSDNLDDKARFNSSRTYEYTEDEEPYKGDFSKDMTTDGATPAFLQKGEEDDDFRKKERMREEMLDAQRKKGKRSKSKLIAILIPIVLIIILVIVVKNIFGMIFGTKPKEEVIPETMATEETYEEETTETETTEPPLPSEAGYYDVTGDLVKVRDKATTEGSKVKGVVSKGDKVYVKKFYNSDWAVVVYEGEESYISRRYIRRDESLSPVFEENTGLDAQTIATEEETTTTIAQGE